jgi:transposase
MPKSYSPEFRRKVLDLLKAGKPVAEVASDLGVTAASIYSWRNQELIDTGKKAGTTTTESTELRKARRRIAELETELAVTKRANELLKEVVPPKGGTRPSR